jgi:hypothetical protein
LKIFYQKFLKSKRNGSVFNIKDLNIFIPVCYINDINVEIIIQNVFGDDYDIREIKNNWIFI